MLFKLFELLTLLELRLEVEFRRLRHPNMSSMNELRDAFSSGIEVKLLGGGSLVRRKSERA
jgi:hypothetical protein